MNISEQDYLLVINGDSAKRRILGGKIEELELEIKTLRELKELQDRELKDLQEIRAKLLDERRQVCYNLKCIVRDEAPKDVKHAIIEDFEKLLGIDFRKAAK